MLRRGGTFGSDALSVTIRVARLRAPKTKSLSSNRIDRLRRSKNPAAIAHLPWRGRGGRRDEASGTVRTGTTSSLCRGDQSAGSGTTLWDRPADGGEDAGVFGAAWLSTEPTAGTAQAGSVCRDHRPDLRRR